MKALFLIWFVAPLSCGDKTEVLWFRLQGSYEEGNLDKVTGSFGVVKRVQRLLLTVVNPVQNSGFGGFGFRVSLNRKP